MSDVRVSAGTTSTGLVANGYGSEIEVYGTTYGTAVLNAGVEYVDNGGRAFGTNLYGSETISGLTYDATQGVNAGGTASGTILSSGAAQAIAGGTASGTVVSSGGQQDVFAGMAVDATVSSGGAQDVYNGAVVFSTVVDDGGSQNISGGALAVGTTVSGIASIVSGVSDHTAFELVSSGGVASDTLVEDGGAIRVFAGGIISNAVVSGTNEYVSSGNMNYALAAIIVSSGGLATGTQVENGGQLNVRFGGITSGASVSGSALVAVVNNLTAGGFENVSSGGVAVATSVGSGGGLKILSGGLSDAAVLSAAIILSSGGEYHAGYENVLAGGVASGTIVGSGTRLGLLGHAYGAVISNGGEETISSGGVATGTQVMLGGQIDVYGLTYDGGQATIDATTDVLSVTESGVSYTQQLAGNYVGDAFTAAPDLIGSGTALTLAVACYCPGTGILTESGQVPIEMLRIGDLVCTHAGRAEPIRWIGRRSYGGRFLTGRAHLLPVRIRAGSLGGGLPLRDLRVSPQHALYLDEMLVPAIQLVNGRTIVQERGSVRVDYMHLEFAGHEVIWAEGALAESFVDDDSRALFHNAAEFDALYPEETPQMAVFYAQRVTDGYALELLRERLAVQAKWCA